MTGLRFLIILNLILSPFSAPAGTQIPDIQVSSMPQSAAVSQMQNYINAMSDVPMTPGNESLLVNDSNQALSLLGSNTKAAQTPQGRQLLSMSRRILNYSKMEKTLSSCAKDKSGLRDKILALSSTMKLDDSSCTCSPKQNSLSPVFGAVKYSQLENQITRNAIVEAVDKYFDTKNKYDDGDTSHLIDTLCGDKCTSQDRALMQQRLDQLNKKPKPTKLDTDHQFFLLNNKLAEANKALATISVDPLHPAASENSADNKRKYEQYEQKYLEALGSESGFLLNTNTLQDYFGKFKTFDHDLNWGVINRGFDQHHVVGNGNHDENPAYGSQVIMKKAINEAEKTMVSQFQDIADMDRKKLADENGKSDGTISRAQDKSASDLEELVQTNPVAVAQVLINNPDATKDVCDILAKLDQDNASKALHHTIALWGVGIAAGALAVTGVGLGAAVWLAGGIETAAVTAPGLITATVVVAGGATAVSAAGTGEAVYRAVDANNEYEMLRSSFVAGSTYNSSGTQIVAGQDVQKSLNSYYTAKNQAVLSGLGTAADALGLGVAQSAASAAKTARAAASVEELSTLTATTQTLTDMTAANKDGQVVSTFKRMASTEGDQDTNKVIQYFSKASQDVRQKILQKMKTFDNQTLKKFADDVLAAGKNCG